MKHCPNCNEPEGDINSNFFIADDVWVCLSCGKSYTEVNDTFIEIPDEEGR